jgi:hypothetical protein
VKREAERLGVDKLAECSLIAQPWSFSANKLVYVVEGGRAD